MKIIAKIASGCLFLLATVVGAQAADDVDLDAQQLEPVYLYKDVFGNTLTYDVVPNGSGGISAAEIRYVSDDEVALLRDSNMDVRFVSPNADGAGRDDIAQSSPIIPSLPSLPENFSIVQVNGVVYGNFFVPGDRPAGATTQWLAYFLGTINMEQFISHMAVSLLFDSEQLIDNYPPTYAPALVGNGFVIGNVSKTPNGCGFAENHTPVYNMEVESFWNGGNKLYSETCSPEGLEDLRAYYVNVSADVSGHVSYDVVGGTVWFSPTADTAPDRPAGSAGSLSGGGLLFGLVSTPSAPWFAAVNFFGAKTGWY